MDPWHAASGTGLLLVAGLTFFAVLAYLRYRAPRVVACPADGSPAAVRADARHAALTLLPRADLRIRDCSRWPARRHCGQMCLDQVESDPLRSPVERFLARWYAERPCARCGAAFRDVQWVRRPPALMDERGRLARWYEHPERLTGVPDRYLPVCWSCHRAATAARAAVEAGAPAPSTAPRSREA